jgi:hypothetical protein
LTQVLTPLHVITVAPVPQLRLQPAPAQVHVAAPSHMTSQAPAQVTVHVLEPLQVAVE